MKVKLEDIIEAMEFANMETEYYYDTHRRYYTDSEKKRLLHQLNVTPIAGTLVGAAVIIFVWICMTVLICVLRL